MKLLSSQSNKKKTMHNQLHYDLVLLCFQLLKNWNSLHTKLPLIHYPYLMFTLLFDVCIIYSLVRVLVPASLTTDPISRSHSREWVTSIIVIYTLYTSSIARRLNVSATNVAHKAYAHVHRNKDNKDNTISESKNELVTKWSKAKLACYTKEDEPTSLLTNWFHSIEANQQQKSVCCAINLFCFHFRYCFLYRINKKFFISVFAAPSRWTFRSRSWIFSCSLNIFLDDENSNSVNVSLVESLKLMLNSNSYIDTCLLYWVTDTSRLN